MSSLERMNKVLGDVSFFLEQNGIEPQPSYNQNRVSDYFVLISFTGSLYFAKSKGKDTQKNWHKVGSFSLCIYWELKQQRRRQRRYENVT